MSSRFINYGSSSQIRSRSLSYGTIFDDSPRTIWTNASTSNIGRRPMEGEECTPLLEGGDKIHKDSKVANSRKLTASSQWITRMTPPLVSAESDLRLDFARNSEKSVHDDEFQERRNFIEDDGNTNYSKRDKVMVAMFSVAAFLGAVVFSCIAPFFPEEAKSKGASETVTGFVFGIFQLVVFLVSPLFGRYMTAIGSKFMYGTGLCVTGVTAILFGLLNLAPSGVTFISLAFAVRIFEGVGDAAIVTSAFAIVAKTFTSRVGTVIGILETFNGLGFAAGPPIGGALYQIGGFQMPFMILGSVLIIAGIISFFILPKQTDPPTLSKDSILSLLRKPVVLTMVYAITVASMSISFLDPTLEPHISEFNLSPLLVGFVFLIIGGVYALTAPLWGCLIDMRDCAKWVMLFGCVSSFISLLLIGPSPIFAFDKTLWLVSVSEVFMGLGLGAMFIPPFQQCFMIARRAGYPDTLETYALVSGLMQASISFGAFIGPTAGGFAVQLIGFPWAATGFSLLHLICATFVLSLLISEKRRSFFEDVATPKSSSTSIVSFDSDH